MHRPVRPPSNLPVPPTDFIGREGEIAEAGDLLERVRLLTLTGPGGSGKTRLALEIARRRASSFPEGVAWVELAPLRDPALLPRTLASALGLEPRPGTAPAAAVVEHLRARRLLLVLDNCEHLVAACADLAAGLLARCPELRLLTTSREVLDVAGETAWPVPPLSLPGAGSDPEEVARAEAVRLFLARARAASPAFRLTPGNADAVARVCRRLDGIPLALELAAARVRVLAPEQIDERLDRAFLLLAHGTRTAVPRQQTLRAAMDWSHELLAPGERVLFRRLAVFAGTYSLAAVEASCASGEIEEAEVLDLLTRLVDKSLVAVHASAEVVRYRLLETVRQYAAERLRESGEEEAVRDRHAAHFLALAEAAEPGLLAAGQGEWMNRLEADHDNLRAALRHLLARGDRTAAARLGGALWRFWQTRGHLAEGRAWLEEALAPGPGAPAAPAARAKALKGAGVLAWGQGDYARSAECFDEALALAHEAADEDAIAGLLNNLGVVALHQGDYPRAGDLFERSLELRRRQGDDWGIATALNNLGAAAGKQGHAERARAYYEESLALQRQMRNTQGTALGLGNLAAVAYGSGDWEEARRLYEESLALRRHLGDKTGIADSLGKLGAVALRQGDAARAGDLYHQSLPLLREVGDKERLAWELVGIAGLALARGRTADAVRLLGAADAVREAIGAPLTRDEQGERDRHVAAARAALGETVFAATWAEGRATSLEEALEAATALLRPEGPQARAVPAAPAPAPAAETEAELAVLALGPPEIRRGEILLSPADWGSAKPRELLFHLLCHPEGRTKEQIGLALWPEASPARLRSSFHFTLHHLRRTLGRPEWIRFEGGRYAFDRSLPYAYDVERFEERLARAAALRLADVDGAIEGFREGLHLYRGDFLDGTLFGDWVEEPRDRLRRRFVEALSDLAELLFDAGRYGEAAGAYRRLLAHDRLLEGAHRALMRCHVRLGERERALRHYPVLVALLREELDTAPDPATTALFERLRRGEET